MPLRLQRAERRARIRKGIELEIGVEQGRAQRPVDRGEARERVIERALGQRPEVDVVPGGREHPGIFELLGAPDLGEAIGFRPGRRAMARNRGVHVEQRSVGVEHEGADRHRSSSAADARRSARLMSAIRDFHGQIGSRNAVWTAPNRMRSTPMAAQWLVQDLDLLRRRLARGQYRHHRPAHPCVLARLLGVRRRARLRGRDARSRPALRARERFRAKAVPQAARHQGDLDGSGRGRHASASTRTSPLYIRPMYWAEHGATLTGVSADPESTRWCLCLYETPMPPASAGVSITLSPFRRPTHRMHAGRRQGRLPLSEQRARACSRRMRAASTIACCCDMLGNVAELATANIFFAKDGVVYTPAAERHVPQRHHAPPHHQAAARCRRHGGRRLVPLFGFPERRRDLLHRQLLAS